MAMTNLFSRVKKKEALVSVESRPLMAMYGWLGDVGKTDALSFAKGLASSNATNPDNVRVFTMAFEGGYAYEVQEGGPGKPYLPAILELLTARKHGEFVYLSTARRLVRVDRDIRGISSVWMPESENEPTSEGVLTAETGMTLAVPDAAGWIKVGTWMLMTGVITAVIPVIAFSVALPLLFSGGAEEVGQPSIVPVDRWATILSTATKGNQVKALEFISGKWEVRSTPLANYAVEVEVPAEQAQPAQPSLDTLPQGRALPQAVTQPVNPTTRRAP